MAWQGVLLDQDQFCSICQDLMKEPVTIPCGHSYCISCIEGCWDQDDLKLQLYHCPQCKQTFTQRPALRKNNMLAEVVKELKKTGLQAAPPDLCYAGPGDVTCDVCTSTGRQQKALKSCLVCLASFCETHLQPHYDVAPLKKHTLVKASTQLQEKICSHHDEVLKIFCHTDQQCICLMCVMDKHKGHNTVSVAAGRTEIQRRLGMNQERVLQRIQEREKDLNELQKIVESLASAVEDSERIFTELIRSIEKRRSEVKQLIRAQQSAAVSQAEGLLEQLKQEIAELKRRDAELEQLSHTEDHIHFLQNYHALSSPIVSSDLHSIADLPLLCLKDMCEAVSDLKEKLENFLKEELPKISNSVSLPEPKTRTKFLKYSCQLMLDPNTAKKQLSLSEGNRKVTFTSEVQPYPYHPERFTDRCQVLCRDGLSGRCYYEVEWRMWGVYIAVSYKDISRTGSGISQFGHNDKSWSLQCCPRGYSVRHNDVKTKVSGPHSFRVGVYLDHNAGVLSFYSVLSDTMTLLHKFQTTFTQPLYPGLWLSTYGDNAELCELK